MRCFRIRKQEDFQHYKNRNPPWIMLHLKLFGSQRFLSLAEKTRWHALALALIASRYDNHLSEDQEWLKNETHSKTKIDLDALFNAEFIIWCDCEECATDCSNLQQIAAHRRGEESIGEENILLSVSGSSNKVQEVFDEYLRVRENHCQRKNGHKPSSAPALTKAIRLKIARAIREHSFDKAKAAGQGIFLSPFHTGKNDRNTEYLQPSVAWKMPNTAGNGPDNVEIFSELYFNEKARG